MRLWAYRGEAVADLVAEVERLTESETDPQTVGGRLRVRATAALAEGRLADARQAYTASATVDASDAHSALALAARAALWERHATDARGALATLDATGVHRPVVEAERATIRAGLAALEGPSAEALARYRDALRAWRELGLVWDEALCAIDMATLVGPAEPEVSAAAEAAREILTRLGAKPFLVRLEAAMGRSTSTEPSTSGATEPTESRSATPS